jgi:hypothetical protein
VVLGPWYNETDEETFLPWTGALPVRRHVPRSGDVRAAGWKPFSGIHDPSLPRDGDGGDVASPVCRPTPLPFLGGMFDVTDEEKLSLYAALGKDARAVFPVQFSADLGLATGAVAGQGAGFYRARSQSRVLETNSH